MNKLKKIDPAELGVIAADIIAHQSKYFGTSKNNKNNKNNKNLKLFLMIILFIILRSLIKGHKSINEDINLIEVNTLHFLSIKSILEILEKYIGTEKTNSLLYIYKILSIVQ